jgi:hypothetical protein
MVLASRMTRLTYVLQIYIAGEKGRSRSAVQNLKKICDKQLPGQYKIKVVDVSKNPRAAVENNLTPYQQWSARCLLQSEGLLETGRMKTMS